MRLSRPDRFAVLRFVDTIRDAAFGAHGSRHLAALGWFVSVGPVRFDPELRAWGSAELTYHEAMCGRPAGLAKPANLETRERTRLLAGRSLNRRPGRDDFNSGAQAGGDSPARQGARTG